MLDNLNINYCGDMTVRYMYFEAEDVFDFREKMLSANSIEGHLSLSVQHNSDGKIFLYDISSLKSLREYLQEKNTDKVFLRSFLSDMEKAFISGKAYMLCEDDYCIHPDTVYFDMDGSAFLCYLPGYERDIHDQLCSLFEFVMDRVDMNDKISVYAAYRITSAIKDENCTFQTLLQMINEGEKETFSNYTTSGTLGMDEELLRSGALLKFEDREKIGSEAETEAFSFRDKFGRSENKHSGNKGKGNNQLIGYAIAIVSFILVIIYFIFV